MSNQPVFVRPPHIDTEFKSEKEVWDFQKCCDPKTGYLYFMENFFHIQHPTRGSILYQPFDYQRRLIDVYHNYRRSIALLPRQTGKTTSAAGYLLWYAMFVPDSTILIAAHKYTGAQEIMQRIRYAYEACPWHIKAGAVSYNKGSLEFDNGSRIVSATTTENTGRGMSISLIYLDEFSFVRPSIASEFWTSITPTLSTGGKAIITSTPGNDEDQFAQIWQGANKCEDEFGNKTDVGVNGYKAFRSYWDEHPERGPDSGYAEEMRSQLGEERFAREILCEFVSHEETLISPLTLANLQAVEPIEKHGQVRWYKKPVKGHTYVVTLDPSLGTGGDFSAIQVVDGNTTEQICEWKHNKTTIQEQIKLLAKITEHISEITREPSRIYYSVENNTVGEAALVAINEYGEENINGTFMSETGKKRRGFTTTHKSKIAACAKLKSLLESGKMKVYSRSLISELKSFISAGDTYKAKQGQHDDLVMSLLLAVRLIQLVGEYDIDLDNQMRDYGDVIMPLPFFAMFS